MTCDSGSNIESLWSTYGCFANVQGQKSNRDFYHACKTSSWCIMRWTFEHCRLLLGTCFLNRDTQCNLLYSNLCSSRIQRRLVLKRTFQRDRGDQHHHTKSSHLEMLQSGDMKRTKSMVLAASCWKWTHSLFRTSEIRSPMDLVSNFPPILNFINKDLEIQDKTKQNPLPLRSSTNWSY